MMAEMSHGTTLRAKRATFNYKLGGLNPDLQNHTFFKVPVSRDLGGREGRPIIAHDTTNDDQIGFFLIQIHNFKARRLKLQNETFLLISKHCVFID